MIAIGIDPGGTSGAISVVERDPLTGITILHAVADMPVLPKLSGKGKEVNAQMLHDIIQTWRRVYKTINFVFIERVHAMPGQGVTSMFNFGRSLGCIEGVVAAYRIHTKWPTPQAWKKHFGLLKKPKDAARTYVIDRFPTNLDLFKRKKDGGRADATLIALHGLETL